MVFADKTSNIYKLNTDEYKNLTIEAVTSTYKKVSDEINNKVNTEGERTTENKIALDRIFINGKNNCFITLKDHKETFFYDQKIIYHSRKSLLFDRGNTWMKKGGIYLM